MSLSDPVADFLTKIRNASMAQHQNIYCTTSYLLDQIIKILKKEGFIRNYSYTKNKLIPEMKIDLKYYKNKPVIRGITRVSKPGRRVYLKWKNIPSTLNNIGIGILSTPKGVISAKEAKYQHVGGEFICKVW